MGKVFTLAEVAEHNTPKDCWLIIDGKVYDVTKFLEDHPGGDEVLLSATGKDATDDFEDVGHSSSARVQMEELYVGDIDSSTIPNEGADGGGNDGNIRKDLSDWQEKHAILVLSKVKELSQLRFRLCPRYLKEREFWTIYFSLARSYIIEYELRAVRLEKLKNLSMENGTVSNTSAYEVEMSEAKHTTCVEPVTSIEKNLDGPQS